MKRARRFGSASIILLGIWMGVPSMVPAQPVVERSPDSGGEGPVGITDRMSPDERSEIEAILTQNVVRLEAAGKLTLPASPQTVEFHWPLRPADGFWDPGYHGISNFVDHGGILDYACGRRTYGGHNGTDFFTWPFSWYKMDFDQVEVVAAARGTIIHTTDGNFDRSCSWEGAGPWNAVYVMHADSSVSWYGHLKKGSVTTKAVGETVEVGEYLGIVGSSGRSSGPHLHFETNWGRPIVDPYEGECNGLNDESWWVEQRPYRDSAINALMIHRDVPTFSTCSERELFDAVDALAPGETALFTVYFRDQEEGDSTRHRILMPDGSEWQEWVYVSTATYNASWWSWSWTLPADGMQGLWRWEVDYNGRLYEHQFDLAGVEVSVERPGFSAADLVLEPVHPNPASSQTRVRFTLEKRAYVDLVVVDALGRVVRTLESGALAAGRHTRVLSLEGLPPGIYFCRLAGANQTVTRKLVVGA